ncbi:sulfurtransferase [Microbacterium caowuchunii]|uniref:rhodanese-like domain-containing protein n=1 Tax=Microbacterium caowuchunii TaxID=2614638 RepID=UPI001244CE1B|nr:rhodanese-like domain-containing protein [Microbacterium caowuchunii]QEW00267.1 sulfurtransferase [Microbacterium caowuchunii]
MTDAIAYFTAKLTHETDPSDVYSAQRAGEQVTLIDVRDVDAWTQGRIPGAVHMPYREIASRAPAEIPAGTPVIVYCWSPGCNGGAKAAREFAVLGYPVKEMIGGYEYWAREGQPTESDEGALPRTFDPLVMTVRASPGVTR